MVGLRTFASVVLHRSACGSRPLVQSFLQTFLQTFLQRNSQAVSAVVTAVGPVVVAAVGVNVAGRYLYQG